MNQEKIEGTIVLEGLLQGRLPDGADIEPQLREWVMFVEGLGLQFALEVSNRSFSLLPDTKPVSVARFGDSAEHTLTEALEQLVSLFAKQPTAQLFSTLRSREYRPQQEVQTLYAVTGAGVKPQSSIVEAETTPPPEPLSWKVRLQLAGAGLVFALLIIGVALLFPGTRQFLGQLFESVRRVDPHEVDIDASAYAPYFTQSIDDAKSGGQGMTLVLKRTAKFPKNDAELATAIAGAGDNVRQRLAVESLARGFVRVDLFDADGNLITHNEARITDLRTKETREFAVPFPNGPRVARIVFVP